MAVINNIKELRKNHGAAQKDIAAGTGFSTRTIRAVERGERDPSAEFMLRIASYFNLMVEDIFQIGDD
jgi:putative transcriptional regulator